VRIEVDTPHGTARVHLHRPVAKPRAALMLGHGAGGSVDAPDLAAVSEVALEEGMAVALVEQPYRVAGRKSSPAPKQLDTAWLAVVEHLREHQPALPLIAGGRSAGARVACRTAAEANAAAVLCLAFPLRPPRRKTATEDPPSRLPELEAVSVPVLIVQGERDRFGMPEPAPGREVVRVPGDHSLKQDLPAVAAAAREWLRGF
jgi:predicted alpha/beta-hydrolase family hydrolase